MSTWNIHGVIESFDSESNEGIHPLVLRILKQRGFSEDDIASFLNPQYEHLNDPFLFRDMRAVVDRIRTARDAGEHVFVYGDYDADGVTSSTLMVETLREVGIREVDVYIPHREREGYGLNNSAIDLIKSEGGSLIITVDCATSNAAEITYAKGLGIDVIIIDHHEEPEVLPSDAFAVLNPHMTGETYPFKQLAACGVVFKTVQALWQSFDLPAGHEKWFLDLVAIATVADMMPLVGENRIFVSFGLKVLNKTRRPGLKALVETAAAKGDIGVYEIGFVIGPRLNAAGRIDHANNSFELLAQTDEKASRELAAALDRTNTERQSETERILKDAQEQAKEQYEAGKKVLCAKGDDWQAGVVGLASGRITERYYRPSLVVTMVNGRMTGSGRSIPGFNITEALQRSSEFLERFGGHEGACGFTLASPDALMPFVESMNRIADSLLVEEDLVKKRAIDLEMPLSLVDWDVVGALEEMSPFGIGNPRPTFASRGVRVDTVSLVGSDGKHMRIMFNDGKRQVQAIAFGFGEKWHDVLNPGDLADIAYEVSVNEWQGRKSIQLKIADINHHT